MIVRGDFYSYVGRMRLPAPQKAVLRSFGLAHWCSFKTGLSDPTTRQLEEDTGLDKAVCGKATKALLKRGELTLVSPAQGRRQAQYRVTEIARLASVIADTKADDSENLASVIADGSALVASVIADASSHVASVITDISSETPHSDVPTGEEESARVARAAPPPPRARSKGKAKTRKREQAAPVPVPSAFHAQVLDSHRRILPNLPQVRIWTNDLARSLNDRIAEALEQGESADTLAFWERYFETVAGIPFLLGKGQGIDGGYPASLGQLLSHKCFNAVLNGQYTARAKPPHVRAPSTEELLAEDRERQASPPSGDDMPPPTWNPVGASP